uniref:Uncharacterized protein n=1 Tax=Oryza rufipogon TaxID=4529 RepID=A0A0E0RIC5_ORYRU
MWYNWLLLYTEWLRRRCYCFVRSCCYKRDYPVGTEEPAQGGPDADDLSHREVGVFYDVHRLGEYAESFVDEGLANLTSVAARYI